MLGIYNYIMFGRKKVIKKIKDIQIGDIVKTPKGKARVIGKTDVFMPSKMFLITFENGSVKCSDTHQWVVYFGDNEWTVDTLEIFTNKDHFIENAVFGIKNGIKLKDIIEIPPEPVQCITLDDESQLFEIILKQE